MSHHAVDVGEYAHKILSWSFRAWGSSSPPPHKMCLVLALCVTSCCFDHITLLFRNHVLLFCLTLSVHLLLCIFVNNYLLSPFIPSSFTGQVVILLIQLSMIITVMKLQISLKWCFPVSANH